VARLLVQLKLRLLLNALRSSGSAEASFIISCFFAVLVAVLMVSRIPYPHVVNQALRGERGFEHVVALLFAGVAIMSIHGYSVPIIGCAFVLYAPVKYLWQRFFMRRATDPIS